MNRQVNFITLKNNRNLEIVFSNVGASIYSLKYEGKEMLLSPKNASDFASSKEFYGKTLGRVAGRILSKYAGYSLDNTEYNFTLHGGNDNLSYKIFNYSLKKDSDKQVISFSYRSKHLECGFPGVLELKVYYILYDEEDKLKIEYEALSDQDTILNLSNHMYFNFSTPNLNNYELYIPASRVLAFDEHLLPYGEMEVPKALDFRVKTKLKEKIDLLEKLPTKTIDHTFIFDDACCCSLENEEYKLTVNTSYEALNCYLNCTPKVVPYLFNEVETRYRGLAIEPQHNNLNAAAISLKKGKIYNEFIIYSFERK